jgi:hypothetical protein
MLKARLNLRKVVAMAICLAGFIVFVGCEKDPIDNHQPPTEQELTGLQMLVQNEVDAMDWGKRIPISYDPISWEKDAAGKFIKYNRADVSYLGDVIRLTYISDNISNGTMYDTTFVALANGRVKQTDNRNTLLYNTGGGNSSVTIRNYYYNEQGFLIRITDPNTVNGEQNVYQATIENENVTKIEIFSYSRLDGRAYQIVTHKYTYNDDIFVPMSDWAPYTPLQLAIGSVALYDNLLGKKSKNNIINVDREYQNSEYQAHINKLTYELEYNERNKLAAIKHTGRFTAHQVDGGNQVDFSNTKTLFKYTNK